MPRKADLPTFLTSDVERAQLVAELTTLAEQVAEPAEGVPAFIATARAGALRSWAGQVSAFGRDGAVTQLDGRRVIRPALHGEFSEALDADTAEQH